MTATQVIAEIKALPPQDKEEVLRFTRTLETGRMLSGKQLGVLGEELANATDDQEALRLREEITTGFYGSK